jgi:hypothetical protein
MVTFKGNFTNENLKGDTGRKDPVDEVIDILDQIGQDDFTAQAMSRPRPQSATSPQVTVQQTDKIPMSPEQQAQAFTNLYGGNKSLGLYGPTPPLQDPTDIESQLFNAFSGTPQDVLYNESGFQQASAPSLTDMYYPQERRKGIAGPYEAMDPDMFDPDTGEYINFLDRIDQQRALNAGQGIASVAPVNPMAQERAADYMRALQMGQTEDYKDFFFDEASRDPSIFDPLQSLVQKAFGYPEGMRGLYEMEQNKKAAMARNEELEEFSRKDQEDRERAAMLAAQQQQPVDPCPEGYRLDPVSKVCVPVDDTTEPTDPVTTNL